MLATGDSHTFGVCSNHESWPNRLEARLSERWPERSFDVLNTGQGGHSFYQYLGALEKFLDWRPDVFIVGVYGGNDFSEIVGMASTFGEMPGAGYTKEQRALRREAIVSLSKPAMGQCFNSAFLFGQHPGHIDLVLEQALDLIEQMHSICDAFDIELIVAFIPAPCALSWDPPIEMFEGLRDLPGLNLESLDALDELATRFVDGVRARGIPVADLRAPIATLDGPPYWRRDLHLDVTGHDLLAAELLPLVEARAFETGALSPR